MASQNNRNPNNNQGDPDQGKKPPFIDPLNSNNKFKFSIWYFVIILVGLFLINYFFTSTATSSSSFIDFSEFKSRIASGVIKRVEITDKYYGGYTMAGGQREGIPQYKTVPVFELEFTKFLDEYNVEYYARPTQNNWLLEILLGWLLPIGVLILIWRFMLKRMGGAMGSNVMTFGQNRSKIVAEGDVDTCFKDVAGADEAKQELEEVVDFLKNPAKYSAIGGKIPKGVLLVGPPGCGKTLLGRAVAGEAGVTFFKMSGAEFVEMFVGVGASRVRDLFKQAREKAPCIIFIDELDAIGKSRANSLNGNDEREQTLNQLLVEMDGFDGRTGVIIIGATNRPEILDSALLRPGRFDRQILVDKPDLIGREQILLIHAKNVMSEESVDLKNVAKSTPGFSGADLANVVNEAALLAVRRGAKKVAQKDYEEAIEKVIVGLEKRSRVINPKEKEIVAYHETGHALAAYFTDGADKVRKISIIPRGLSALGYTLQMPEEDRFLMTEQELLGEIDVLLGGRAAEQLIFNQISTGASNDIMKATDIIRKMITQYGMSERFKNVTLPSQRNAMFLDRISTGGREYSEATQQYIDEETARIVGQRYNHVLALLKGKISLLKNISLKLLEEEVLGAERFKELIAEG